MEIVAVDPIVLSMSDEPGIKAGMMAVIPSDYIGEFPEHTLLCAGQTLNRELYPKLSQVYAGIGGFHHFTLPDLLNKFIIGVDEDGEFVLGHGIVYFEDIPNTDRPSRDVLRA